jgi:hypothetical protein
VLLARSWLLLSSGFSLLGTDQDTDARDWS